MKLNVLLPWILVLGMGAALGAVYVKSQAKDRQLAELRQSATAVEELRAQVAEMESRAQAAGDQVLVPRKDKEELIRLRGEVSQLRDQSKRLTRELETAKANAQRAQSEVAAASQTAQSNATMLASVQANQAIQRKREAQAACINHLQMFDRAKQQWALEHQKPATALPQPAEIAAYFPNGTPTCPDGGVYTLNAVNQRPTCSIPNHKLQ